MVLVVFAVGGTGDGLCTGAAGGADADAASADAGRWYGSWGWAAADLDAGCGHRRARGEEKLRNATTDGSHGDAYCDADLAQPDAATADADAFGDAGEPDALRELHPRFAADG